MSNRQPFINEHPILSDEIHIIEENSVNEEESPTDEHRLEDTLDAWQEINSLVGKIGRSLMKREAAALKRSAQEIAQRCTSKSILQGEQQRDDSTHSTPESVSNKRHRVSGFEEDGAEHKSVVQAEEKEALLRRTEHMLRRMARMKRMSAVLQSLNDSHRLLEQEIRGMLDEESREEVS